MQVTCRADLSLKSPDHNIILLPKKKCPHFCNILKCLRASLVLSRFCIGSHVLSESGYPFYFTRNSERLYLLRSAIILSTSYSSVLSIISEGGGSGRGKVFDAMYGLRSETWNVGCIRIVVGRSSLYATEDIFDVNVKGPTKRGRNLRDGDNASATSLRFLVDNKTLSPMSN